MVGALNIKNSVDSRVEHGTGDFLSFTDIYGSAAIGDGDINIWIDGPGAVHIAGDKVVADGNFIENPGANFLAGGDGCSQNTR